MKFQFLFVVLGGFVGSGYAASSEAIAPLAVPPSLYWEGDDGWWSTFFVQVGTPGQSVRLLPGTSASAGSTTWVIIPEGCVDVNPSLDNCASNRGSLFQSNASSSWSTQDLPGGEDGAIFTLNTFEEANLGLSGNASYGYDTIALGLNGSGLPTLEHQIVAGIWTDDFFLGSLGLSPIPFNFTTLNDPHPTVLGTLRNQSLIPSTSWAYTAGAYYHEPPVYGSLTLGGFDTTRFTPNDLTFSFGADFSRDLLVSLQSVTHDAEGSGPLLSSSIDMFIDSMVTEIWLPVDVCEAFAQQFNLTWNSQGQLYLVDDSAHAGLVAQNPTFIFAIGQAGGGGQTVEIVLPYAAFDLALTAPIVGDTTRYFPLKQAQNDSQYTLGRTFLQQAYVIADYERHNFSVSQALFPPTSIAQNIVAIHPPRSDKKKKGNGLSAGAIAGVAVGSALAVALAMLVVVLVFKRWSKRRRDLPEAAETANSTNGESLVEKPQMAAPLEIDGREAKIYEVEGQSRTKPELYGDESYRLLPEVPGEGTGVFEMNGKDPAAVELP